MKRHEFVQKTVAISSTTMIGGGIFSFMFGQNLPSQKFDFMKRAC